MTNTQKDNLKKTVIKALKIEYGFSPSTKEVILLEATGDTYIMFEVNGNQYQYNTDFGLRCGKGTINRYYED